MQKLIKNNRDITTLNPKKTVTSLFPWGLNFYDFLINKPE